MHSQFYLSGLAVHLSILRVPKSVLFIDFHTNPEFTTESPAGYGLNPFRETGSPEHFSH